MKNPIAKCAKGEESAKRISGRVANVAVDVVVAVENRWVLSHLQRNLIPIKLRKTAKTANSKRFYVANVVPVVVVVSVRAIFGEICGKCSKCGKSDVANVAVVVNIAVENRSFLLHLQQYP
jgi:uncharacterized membrane protein